MTCMALIYWSKLKERVAVGGRSSVVRAPAAQAGGPGFDSWYFSLFTELDDVVQGGGIV